MRDGDIAKEAAAWGAWAAQHGWTYQQDAPELIGRFVPPAEKGAERYHHLLRTQLHGLDVMAFQRGWHWYDGHNQDSQGSLRAYVVVHLPGSPPAEVVAMGVEKALRQLGGTIPAEHDVALQGDDLVANRSGGLDIRRLQSVAELLTLQISAVPASFWRPRA
jgi:hypothetical protein